MGPVPWHRAGIGLALGASQKRRETSGTPFCFPSTAHGKHTLSSGECVVSTNKLYVSERFQIYKIIAKQLKSIPIYPIFSFSYYWWLSVVCWSQLTSQHRYIMITTVTTNVISNPYFMNFVAQIFPALTIWGTCLFGFGASLKLCHRVFSYIWALLFWLLWIPFIPSC